MLAAGCGAGSRDHAAERHPGPTRAWHFDRVEAVRFTNRVPPQVRATCARAARRTVSIQVRCPRIVPVGGVVGDPDLYGYGHAPSARSYELTFNNGDNPGRFHWIVGGGRPGTFRRLDLDKSAWVKQGRVVALGTRECAGRAITAYRLPSYPAGGMFGGHTVALARLHGVEYYASVHGYGRLDADIALLLDVLGARPRASRTARPPLCEATRRPPR